MEKNTVIEVEHVSMKFNLASEKYDSLKEYVIKSIRGQVSFEEFWALKDVSFHLEKGCLLYTSCIATGCTFGNNVLV